jgi:hypothetical protein
MSEHSPEGYTAGSDATESGRSSPSDENDYALAAIHPVEDGDDYRAELDRAFARVLDRTFPYESTANIEANSGDIQNLQATLVHMIELNNNCELNRIESQDENEAWKNSVGDVINGIQTAVENHNEHNERMIDKEAQKHAPTNERLGNS